MSRQNTAKKTTPAQATALIQEKPVAVEVPAPKAPSKAKLNIRRLTLRATGSKLSLVARQSKDGLPSTLATITDTTTKAKTRGCRKVHADWDAAVKALEALAVEAVKAGWTQQVASKRGTKATVNSFTSIPAPTATK